ncbi:MAG: squalene/phytoene synthase family protein [Balneolaceae bacterium]|nr:squalene/phytoene synthase family protein [Balneolaceae bacterium]
MSELLRVPYSMFRPIYEKTSFHRSVIEELNDDRLQSAYSHCRAITRFYAKTFYMATRFLPNEKQRSIFAIYGLCRYLDNLVDETMDLMDHSSIDISEVDAKLDDFKSKLTGVYNGQESNDPILIAFSDTLKKYHIPISLPFELMDGVRSDLDKNRYNNFSELYDYSYKVASVVGLMTSRVFGYSDEKALEYAIDLGIAMQLTNILRDIGEDLERNRIYLPKDELAMFEITEAELFAGEKSEKFRNFMDFQIKRARDYYEKADIGIKMLDKDSRLPVYLARYNYSRILDKIEENDFSVFKHRAYLNKVEKFAILPKIFIEMRAAS